MRYLPLVLVIFLMASCVNLADPNMQIRYVNSYAEFHPGDVRHIPSRLPKLTESFTIRNPTSNAYAMVGLLFVSEKIVLRRRYSRIKQDFLDQAIYRGNSAGDNYTLVNPTDVLDQVYTSRSDTTIFPLPYQALFLEQPYTRELTRREDYEILILCVEDSIQTPDVNSCNFISRGVGFDDREKIIRYWTIIF